MPLPLIAIIAFIVLVCIVWYFQWDNIAALARKLTWREMVAILGAFVIAIAIIDAAVFPVPQAPTEAIKSSPQIPVNGSIAKIKDDFLMASTQAAFKEMLLFMHNGNANALKNMGASRRVRQISAGTTVTVIDKVFIDYNEIAYIEISGGSSNGERGYVPAKLLAK